MWHGFVKMVRTWISIGVSMVVFEVIQKGLGFSICVYRTSLRLREQSFEILFGFELRIGALLCPNLVSTNCVRILLPAWVRISKARPKPELENVSPIPSLCLFILQHAIKDANKFIYVAVADYVPMNVFGRVRRKWTVLDDLLREGDIF